MRRRGRSPTERWSTNAEQDDDSDVSVILDTDDQEEMIRQLERDAQKQSRFFQSFFSVVGGFGMVVSLFIYPILCQEECSQRIVPCWAHALVSSGAHGLSIKLSQAKMNYEEPRLPFSSGFFGILIILHVVPPLLWVIGVFDQDVEHFHLGLALGNLVTLVGALLLLWDEQSTRKALNDLNGAKYEHKTL